MQTEFHFILIDDDPINNMLSEMTIEEVFPDSKIVSFTDPTLGLEYLSAHSNLSSDGKSVLFLDLNMPGMTGWEFMEQYEKATAPAKEQLLVYILSSSVNPLDLEKAKNSPYIKDFIEKPITEEVLNTLA